MSIKILDELNEAVLFEISQFRSEVLKEIDKDFLELQKNSKDLKVRKDIVKNIKEFSNIKKVVFSIKKNYNNALVMPVYTKQLSFDIFDIFKNYKPGDNVKNISSVEEMSKYIDKIYIIFGDGILQEFNQRQLTAILLHELGHCFIYTSNIPRIFISIFEKFMHTSVLAKTPILMLLAAGLGWFIGTTIVLWTVARSLTFLEHREEYRADQFVAKYGYGDELIKVLSHFKDLREDNEKKYKWWEKIAIWVKEFFFPATHPKEKVRIEKLSDEMISNYKVLYPKLSDELNIILKDIRSQT